MTRVPVGTEEEALRNGARRSVASQSIVEGRSDRSLFGKTAGRSRGRAPEHRRVHPLALTEPDERDGSRRYPPHGWKESYLAGLRFEAEIPRVLGQIVVESRRHFICADDLDIAIVRERSNDEYVTSDRAGGLFGRCDLRGNLLS
jgi:hypothetical protein